MMKSIKTPIRFKYEIDKFIACMGIFTQKVKNFDKLKACKLLYYADKFHLLKYGRPILGDVYKHLDYGPVPTQSLFIMNEAIRESSGTSDIPEAQKMFNEFIKVNKKMFQKYPTFEIVKEPNLDCLSSSEQEAMLETVKKYGCLKGGRMIDETHKDSTFTKTSLYDEIDYKLFFEDGKEAQPTAALEYFESLREDSELLFGLNASD